MPTTSLSLNLLSDLHLETYREGREDIAKAKLDAEVVILAGDIHRGCAGLEWAAERFPQQEVIYVAGNHEYYRSCLTELRLEMAERAQQLGIHFLDNQTVEIQGVKFFGTTLWTDFQLYQGLADNNPEETYAKALSFMPDFRIVEYTEGQVFTPELSQQLHQQALAWLEQALAQPWAGPRVVISHHAPHSACIPEQFQGDSLSPAFASNLQHLLGKMDLWLHGHVHEPVDFHCQGTRILANPGGYPNEFEVPVFKPETRLILNSTP